VARPLPAEDRQRGGDAVQDTAQIDVDHLVPLLDAQLRQRGEGPHTCVVDEHVQPAEGVECRLDEAGRVLAPPHIGRYADGAAPACADVGGESPHALTAAGAEDDRRPALRQRERGGPAYAAAGAGDGDHLVAGLRSCRVRPWG